MVGKKYSDYSLDLFYQYQQSFNFLDTLAIQKCRDQVKEVCLKTGSKTWELELKYVEYVLFDVKYREKSMDFYEKQLKMMLDLLDEAKKNNILYLELRLRNKIIEIYWQNIKNYELAFEQCTIQAERLKTVSVDDIPEKIIYYVPIADAYYHFKDYPRAMDYYQKIIDEKENTYTQFCKQSALNGLGLCYCEGFNDLDRADSCFRAIMQTNYVDSMGEKNRDNWGGIAEGNIGDNMFLRGEYDQAIPLFKSSIEKMLKFNDYAFASEPAVNLAKIYLKQGKITEAKRYIDLAMAYNTKMSRDGRLQLIYETQSKYYAAMGDTKRSMAYMDSTLRAKEQFDKQYNAMLLHRLDQKEAIKQQQELQREKEVRKHVQIRLLIISAGFLVIFTLSVLLYFLYRRNREAYRALVRKSQAWANVQPASDNASKRLIANNSNRDDDKEQDMDTASPDEFDLSIMEDIERLMQEEKVYHDIKISIDSLAQQLGYKKRHVSEAINRCTNNNFNVLISEYRVKEAIHLLSVKNSQDCTIDQMACDLGFKDRRNFYRVFKKITGLSPSEFKRNLVI